MEEKTGESVSFFQHVFNFDEDTKCELLNISQYSLLSVVPVVLLNKTIQNVIPEADDSKRNLEILVEIIGQILMMFLSVFFVDRIITYIPTYSKTKYQEMNLFSVMILFLVIVLSLQTKLGEKVNILLDRLVDYWGGGTQEKKKGKKGQKAGNDQQHQPSQADYLDTHNMMTQPQAGMSMNNQQVNDFNSMYQNGGDGGFAPQQMEPSAANEGFGAFGSAF